VDTGRVPDAPSDTASRPGPLLQELLRTVRAYEALADPIFMASPDGKIVAVNGEGERALGRGHDEVIGRPVASLFPPQRHQQLDELWQRCLRGESVHNVESARLGPELKPRPVRLSLLRVAGEDGAVLGVVVVARDVSEIKEAEARLQRMNKVFLDSADPIRISDLDGFTLDWNREAERVFGWTCDEMIGKRAKDILPPEWQALADEGRQRCLRGEAVRNWEAVVVAKDGRSIPVLVTAFLLRDEAGEPIGIANIVKDISDLKRLAAELERKNEELRQFAAVVAHDLQQPLNGIAGFGYLLEQHFRGRLDAEADEYITYIIESVDRMQQLIRSLLSYSRLDEATAPSEPADCNFALAQARANLRSGLELSKATLTSDPLPVVRGDGSQLMQLFQNLVGNAIKFRGAEAPRVHVAAVRQGDEWLLSVRDNGIGIADKDRERIFQIFTRLHEDDRYPGTGIGLAACKKIVERHGGRIWVESEPGKGSVFWFTLPACGPAGAG
jgi:PAS domain S-box-containing protein